MAGLPDGPGEAGYKARAGALTLLYLSSPMERSVLLTTLAEATTGISLQEIKPPDPEFLSMGIFEDSYLLEPADPDHPLGAPIGPDTKLRPTPAGREVPYVGAVLANWLSRCPAGPLEHGEESGPHVSALLSGWASMVIHALAGPPLTAAQVCEAVQVIDSNVVNARIDAMLLTDMLMETPGDDPAGELRVQATEWLRRAIAPLAVAARMELRFPPGDTAPVSALDVEAAFLLTLPLLKLSRKGKLSGTCSLAVELDEGVAGSPAGVTARIEGGRVVACEPGIDDDADTWASAGVGDWLDAVIDGDAKRVESGGNRRLAGHLLQKLHRTLFAGIEPLRFRR